MAINVQYQSLPDTLLYRIKHIVRCSGLSGISEYELLKKLEAAEPCFISEIDFRDPQKTFPLQFMLFHHLYRWQEELASGKKYRLEISALQIRLSPLPVDSASLGQVSSHDSLRDYYLDFDNLEKTAGQVLNEMLSNFWKRYIQAPDIKVALETLGLTEFRSEAHVKKQYRKLIQSEHPDKGGCSVRTQKLNEAKAILLQRRGK